MIISLVFRNQLIKLLRYKPAKSVMGLISDEYVRLLGAWPSPFVLRTRIALNLKRVPYEYLEEEDTLNSESVLNYNPVHKQIPILIHGNKPIRESLNIVMYVDETWLSGPPILPSDPFDRAVARFWDVYIDEHVSHETKRFLLYML